MGSLEFPVIDMIATGKNILSLRREKGFTVRDLQEFFGFEEPQAIYRWQYGKTLPSVDNLYALSAILGVPMEEILVPVSGTQYENKQPHQEKPDAAAYFGSIHKEVGIYEADFFFLFRLSHDENDIRFLFCIAERSALGCKEELQITRQAELAATVLHAGIPVGSPFVWSAVKDQAAVGNVDISIIDRLALLSQMMREEAVRAAVQS